MSTHKPWILFFLVWLLAACGENIDPSTNTPTADTPTTAVATPTLTTVPDEPTSDEPTSGEPIRDVANVEAITVNTEQTTPVQVSVTASGNLPDGCTTISGSEQVMLDAVIFLRIFTERPANEVCTEALVPFRQTFPIDVTGLGVGEHPLNVNGVFDTVVLSDDMLTADDPAVVCPAGTEDLTPLVNAEDSYCLLYPLGFEAAPMATGVTTISAPVLATEEDPEPVAAMLTIERVAASTIVDATALAVERLPAEVALEETTVAGETAVVAATSARDLPARQLFLVHNNQAYVLTLTPTDADAYPDAALDAELFWETVVGSFTFLP